MTPDQWGALLSQFGIGGMTVFALYRVLTMVGERFVRALDQIGEKIDRHIKEDLAAHAETSERLARIEKAIDADLLWRERTPVETPPVRPPARAATGEIPIGRYHMKKPKGGE